MKNKFFLCLRPVVIEPRIDETSGGELYHAGKLSSGRRTPRDHTLKTHDPSSLTKRCGNSDKSVRQLKRSTNIINNGSGEIVKLSDKSSPETEETPKSEVEVVTESRKTCRKLVSVSDWPREEQVAAVVVVGKVNVGGGGQELVINSGMYLLVISLFVTMFWGKVLGIVCTTSVALYFLSRKIRPEKMSTAPESWGKDKGKLCRKVKHPKVGSRMNPDLHQRVISCI